MVFVALTRQPHEKRRMGPVRFQPSVSIKRETIGESVLPAKRSRLNTAEASFIFIPY